MTYQVEQHQIKPSHQWWDYCEQVCFASKNLFNTAQYTNRQSYIYGHGIVTQAAMDKMFRDDVNYQLLPAKVSQLVLMQVADAWKSYFKSLKAYSLEPAKFTGKPKAPSYIESDGRNIIKFNHQAISKRAGKNGIISPSLSPIEIPLKPGVIFDSIIEVRIVPKVGCYVVEIVFDDEAAQSAGRVSRPSPCNSDGCGGRVSSHLGAAIDIGIDNLATIVFSDTTIQPLAINGKPLKAENQWMNKEVARLRSILGSGTSQKIQNIIRNRNNFVHTYLHQATAKIASELEKLGVTNLAIGKNPQWKNLVNMGRKNNQSFVQIPHAKFISMLTQKLERIGITVKVGEESYTSKASFLDWDIIPTWTPGKANTMLWQWSPEASFSGEASPENVAPQHKFSGKRIATKKYRAKDGTIIHADINGAFNIARKVLPNLFDSIESMIERNSGCVVAHPRRVIV